MTVASQLTTLTSAEAADDANWDDIGGGPGSGASTDNPIQGSQDRGRRIDNVVRGFSYDAGSGQDISGAGVHVGFWVWVIQPQLIGSGGIELDLGDAATPQSGNWNGYTFAAANYPLTASWLKVWLDPTRTRDVGSGTLALSSVRQFGCEFDMGDISGTSENCHLDQIVYGTGGYVQTGTSVAFSEFRTFESSNRQGVIQTINGIDFVTSRLQWGTSGTAITGDQTLSIVFSTQPLASSTFMGITVDLQNASTDLTLRGFVRSGNTAGNRGDLQVVGTSGALSLLGQFTSLRTIVLTSAVSASDGAILGAPSITPSTATLSGITIRTEAATSVACITSPSLGDMDDIDFVQVGSGHALEIASAGSYTFDNLRFSGYGSNGNDDAAIDVTAASGTVTINVTNGGDTPTYKTAGATVVINNTKTLTVTARDSGGNPIQGARVLLLAAAGGDLPAGASVGLTFSGGTVTVSHTAHGIPDGEDVVIQGANEPEYNGIHQITVTGVNSYTYAISGSPSSPATGSPVSTAVVLEGLTNASGVVTRGDFSYTSDQPTTGRVAKATSSPVYRTQPIGQDITTAGLTLTAILSTDEG